MREVIEIPNGQSININLPSDFRLLVETDIIDRDSIIRIIDKEHNNKLEKEILGDDARGVAHTRDN